MRKKLIAVLGFACSFVLTAGIAACSDPDPITYELDSANFNSTVVFNSTMDYSGLILEASDGNDIAVTESMVSGMDTSSVGEKSFTVTYGEFTQTVNYTVKYEVTFKVGGETKATQLVLSANEIDVPDAYETYVWTPVIPETITGNMTFIGTDGDPEEIPVSLGDVGDFVLNAGSVASPLAVTVPSGAEWEVVTTSNDNISIIEGNNNLLITAKKVGVTTITVNASDELGNFGTATKTVVVKPASMTIVEAAKSYGIENVYTFGRTDVNGVAMTKTLTLSCEKEGAGFAENVVWSSSSANATVDGGVVTLVKDTGEEVVTFKASFYGVEASFKVRCVYDGVNVSNYADLYNATKAQKAIVLGADIAFPTNVADIKYETVHTTYDDQYYKNINKESEATIKVLLQFKKNLYGNGYEINAHNATLGLLDATGALTANSLFRGPLDFVALTQSGASAASVKGQDNVCFGVYENVTINNAVLKAANLEDDLTELNYAGTTVEVFGDNVNIEYSRIMNGRTVLRVFGDATNANKKINVNVKNSVLSGAREFILRMGSNAFVNATDENNISPYLGETLDLIGIKKDSSKKAADYEEKYIKTFVNVSNSVFEHAGIFAVGIDTHFAGKALHDGSNWESWFAGFSNWKNLSKASYGAKLTFNGEVKMYNWKKLEDIDSSTLIEMNETLLGESVAQMLTFDVGAMVQEASGRFPTVVTEDGYVHAGIAFFGGGRNYGLFEDNANLNLEGFEVSLSDVDKSALGTAAGIENFYFNIYDKTTSSFTPEEQNNMSGTEMYACIYNQ